MEVKKHKSKKRILEEDSSIGEKPAKKHCNNKDIDDSIERNISTEPVIFTIVPNCSVKGRDKVFDNKGYSYHLHMIYCNKLGTVLGQYWRCSRVNSAKCRVRLFQKVGTVTFKFVDISCEHTHKGMEDMTSSVVRREVLLAKASKHKEGKTVIKETLAKIANILDGTNGIDHNSIRRAVSHQIKKKIRSKKPASRAVSHEIKKEISPKKPVSRFISVTGLEFNFDLYPHLEITDLFESDTERSILVTCNPYMNILCQSGLWNICLSTEAICQPFKAVLVIQSFCKNNRQNLVKVNLAHIYLSTLTDDVLQESLLKFSSLMPQPLRTTKMMAPPQHSIWLAVKKAFPDQNLKCNLFEWRQMIDEHIANSSVDKDLPIMRRLRCLNLIPAEQMKQAFRLLQGQMIEFSQEPEYVEIKKVFWYVKKRWLKSDIWSPSQWTAYRELYIEEAFKLDNLGIKGLMDHISLINKSVMKAGPLEAVEDINIINEKITCVIKEHETMQNLSKYWRRYENNKFGLESLLNKLSKTL